MNKPVVYDAVTEGKKLKTLLITQYKGVKFSVKSKSVSPIVNGKRVRGGTLITIVITDGPRKKEVIKYLKEQGVTSTELNTIHILRDMSVMTGKAIVKDILEANPEIAKQLKNKELYYYDGSIQYQIVIKTESPVQYKDRTFTNQENTITLDRMVKSIFEKTSFYTEVV